MPWHLVQGEAGDDLAGALKRYLDGDLEAVEIAPETYALTDPRIDPRKRARRARQKRWRASARERQNDAPENDARDAENPENLAAGVGVGGLYSPPFTPPRDKTTRDDATRDDATRTTRDAWDIPPLDDDERARAKAAGLATRTQHFGPKP
jgi:hypothetical protein